MPKFLNKNELVLLTLIILLFDINGLCAITFPYIVNGQGSIIMIILTMIFVSYSAYIYHSVNTAFPGYSIKYATSNDHTGVPSCNNEVNYFTQETNTEIDEMKKICTEKPMHYGNYISEIIVFTLIVLMLLMFIFIGIFKVVDSDGNTKGNRALRAIPMIIIVVGISLFTYIYVPFFSNIQY